MGGGGGGGGGLSPTKSDKLRVHIRNFRKHCTPKRFQDQHFVGVAEIYFPLIGVPIIIIILMAS